MNQRAAIRYRDFWDVPRIFLASYQGLCLLFDCPFDEQTEDYPDSYKVYVLPHLSEEELAGSWDKFASKAKQYLGEMPVARIQFDPSKRQSIDSGVITELLSHKSAAG